MPCHLEIVKFVSLSTSLFCHFECSTTRHVDVSELRQAACGAYYKLKLSVGHCGFRHTLNAPRVDVPKLRQAACGAYQKQTFCWT